MRPKTRALLQHCVENGIIYGYARAHKHTDIPDQYLIQQSIEREIWGMIDEYFDFEEPHDRKD